MELSPRRFSGLLRPVIFLLMALALVGSEVRGADDQQVSPIFKDMGVVQNKAMNKRGRFILLPSFSLDFSDGPYTLYGIGASAGYAISDFWEIHAIYRPAFITRRRKWVETVESTELPGGNRITISGGRARSEIGAQLIWAPLYGKDSLGTRTIIRSDSFLRFGFSKLRYDQGAGQKYALGIGKTFFLSKSLGLRVVVEESWLDVFIQGEKKPTFATFVESGLAFYF